MKRLFRNAYVVVMDDAGTEHEDGWVLVEDGLVAAIGGGVVVVEDRGVRAELALPVAGLISEAPLTEVVEASSGCIEAAAKLGCTLPSPFQTMSFLALSVIPSLKITDHGLVDVDRFELVPLQA